MTGIKKIVLEVGGKAINLTIEQAKELQELLNDTFGDKKVEYIYRNAWPYYQNPQPYWYCSTSGGNLQTTEVTMNNWTGQITSNSIMLKAA